MKEKLQALMNRAELLVNQIKTEEATKQSLILPFFQILEYDVFNPLEFCPEFVADVGIKKGEKVDYCILLNDVPTILVEAKGCFEKLDKHDSQLFRYFSTTKAKFAILTNGIVYRFYTDLDEPNVMDRDPFLEIDLFNLKDSSIEYLKQFQKSNLDLENIYTSASELKYMGLIKRVLRNDLENPSDNFISYLIGNFFEGRRTSLVIEKFKPLVKRTFNQFITELMSEKFEATLKVAKENMDLNDDVPSVEEEDHRDNQEVSRIITTFEELEAYAIIKSIIRNEVELERINSKDTESYFAVLLDNNARKWICRLDFNSKTNKLLLLPSEDKGKPHRINLESLNDLYSYSDLIVKSLRALL